MLSGISQTKWWYQENGETKQELRPVSANAMDWLPRCIAVRRARQVRMKMTMTDTIQMVLLQSWGSRKTGVE